MPSLWKHPASKYFTCCFTAADGRQMKRSTKQTNRQKATEVCLAMQRAEDVAKSGNATEIQMRKVLSDTLERVTGERLQAASCKEWLEQWVRSKKGSVEEKTLLKYEQVTRGLIAYLGSRSKLKLEAITQADIVGFRDDLAAGGRSPSTVNQLIFKSLSVCFSHAQRAGVIAVNPCATVPKLVGGPEARDPFTADQVKLLLAKAEGDWKGAILAGYYTGARLQDVCNLTWSNIDMTAGILSLVPRKTKQKRPQAIKLPLHPELMEYLQERTPGLAEDVLFPSLAGRDASGNSGLSVKFREIMNAAGVTGRIIRKAKGKGRTLSSLSFHSLRHAFNTALANAGVVTEIRQELVGHADARTNKNYTHRDFEKLREAVQSVPRL